jgi:hypothetical protein
MAKIKSKIIEYIGSMVFNTTFNNISAISWQSILSVEETKSTWRKSCRKSLTNFITLFCIQYTSPEWESNPQR